MLIPQGGFTRQGCLLSTRLLYPQGCSRTHAASSFVVQKSASSVTRCSITRLASFLFGLWPKRTCPSRAAPRDVRALSSQFAMLLLSGLTFCTSSHLAIFGPIFQANFFRPTFSGQLSKPIVWANVPGQVSGQIFGVSFPENVLDQFSAQFPQPHFGPIFWANLPGHFSGQLSRRIFWANFPAKFPGLSSGQISGPLFRPMF